MQLTKVTVILDHGDGTFTEEVQPLPGSGVVEGEARVVSEDETDSEEKQ